MPVHFKRVSNTDELEQIAQLATNIWRQHYIPIIGQPQVEYMLKKYQSVAAIKDQISQAYSYYLISDTQLVGYFAIHTQSPNLFLSKLYIDNSKRKLGYATESMDFIHTIALDKGLKGIELTVNKQNTGSILFYEKLGFKRIKEIEIDIGDGYIMDDYLMQWIF